MKDASRDYIKTWARLGLPDARERLQFCLQQLWSARITDNLGAEVVHHLRFEELLGALLAADEEIHALRGSDRKTDDAFGTWRQHGYVDPPLAQLPDADDAIGFCLARLYEDAAHRLSDELVSRLTFEELIAGLLAAQSEIRYDPFDEDSDDQEDA